ncbi:MAG TPA: L,D-transpeptidase [Bdellovibrionales bacterium]|nr:L,D-transpeptidase [Bdellovibrionales bacterium]
MSNIKLLRLTVYGLMVTVIGLGSVACSNSRWHEVREKNKNTGDEISEQRRSKTPPKDLKKDQTVYPTTDRLRGRKSPTQHPADSNEILEKNEPVKVIDPVPQGEDQLIEVVRIDTRTPEAQAQEPAPPQKPVFIPAPYVSKEPTPDTVEEADANRYFMVQNIATEKVRVYRRCTAPEANGDCPHTLVLETDMSAGEDTPDKSRRTILGSFKITAWFKFYEDNQNLFPSWYRAYYPQIPGPGAELNDWLSTSLLPDHRGLTRGSFGWYTAHLGPDADAQWTHGTFGWGADGGKFIELIRDEKINAQMDPRSMGCTRVENQAIAWMREKLPVGTAVIKVYAREGYTDPDRRRYQDFELAKWDWILTKQGVNESGAASADRVRTERAGLNETDVLERGTYSPDQVPDAIRVTGTTEGATASNGNLYNIPLKSFKGLFLVDEGKFSRDANGNAYEHPKELRVGGHAEHKLPKIVLK